MPRGNLKPVVGRLAPCCISLKWALSCGYVKKGYAWFADNVPTWIPWTLNVTGEGYKDTSPIAFCPFCGVNLDKPEPT